MTEQQLKDLFLLTKQLTLANNLVSNLQDSVLDYDKLDRIDAMALALLDANNALKEIFAKLAT